MALHLERRNLLFKTKNTNKQPASSSGQGGDEQYNIVEGGRTHSREAKVADLVEKHLQTQRKIKKKQKEMGRGGVSKSARSSSQIYLSRFSLREKNVGLAGKLNLLNLK
jgi:hypothetical protein